MLEKIKDLYNEYLDQFMTWYDGLSQLGQYGFFFVAFVGIGLAIAFFMLSRITKR
jgi:hypothetical protein